MFSEIYTSKQPAPLQSYALMACSLGVTVATLVFPNLQHVFGSFDEGTDFMQRLTVAFQHALTVAFQHGFEWRSSVVHLLIDLVLMAFIAVFTEKVLGAWMFFLLSFHSCMVLACTYCFRNDGAWWKWLDLGVCACGFLCA